MKAVTIATALITDDMRQQLFDNAQAFEIAVNEALAPYQVKFLPCQSLSKRLRESPLFQEA
jgi:hypothetical protein